MGIPFHGNSHFPCTSLIHSIKTSAQIVAHQLSHYRQPSTVLVDGLVDDLQSLLFVLPFSKINDDNRYIKMLCMYRSDLYTKNAADLLAINAKNKFSGDSRNCWSGNSGVHKRRPLGSVCRYLAIYSLTAECISWPVTTVDRFADANDYVTY